MPARRIALAAMALVAGPALAAPESYTIDPRHTYPSFEVSHYGFSMQRGRFNKTSGRIQMDREAKTIAVEIIVNASSIDTGLEDLEVRLRKPDFLDVENHPAITFKASSSTFEGNNLKTLHGELTMRGETRPVTLTLNRFICGQRPGAKKPQCGADAVTSIKRSDFGMKYGLPILGDEVNIQLQIEAYKD
jgi:polyisoprenoid-binding protein YceI